MNYSPLLDPAVPTNTPPAEVWSETTANDALLGAALAARTRVAPSAPEQVTAAKAAISTGGLRGLATAASIVSAWELPEAPKLTQVPDACWGPYATWLLAVASRPAAETRAAVARHLTARFSEIADWMERNLASAPIRAAADAALSAPLPPPNWFPPEARLPLQQARARVLLRAIGRPAPRLDPPPPRAGRALRLGVVADRLDHRPRTFALLARCAQLDPARVELHIFVREAIGSNLEQTLSNVSASLEFLPDPLAARHSALLAARLDAVLFAEDLATHRFPDAHLAQLRVAPLQIAFGPVTTALPQIDLILLGAADPEACRRRHFEERPGLLPGTLECYDLSPDRGGAPSIWTRELLLPDPAAKLVVCGLPPSDELPAALARWRALLAAAPETFLLILPPPGVSQAELDPARTTLLSAGETRLLLHEPAPADHGELASLIALADLALDLSPVALPLAIEAGVPTLALRASRSSVPLQLAGLHECVHQDDADLVAGAAALLTSPEKRETLAHKTAAADAALPPYADTYALAADFAGLLETAVDELREVGPGAFRRKREPLAPAAPHSTRPTDLLAEARTLIEQGRPARAVPCLLSALQRAGENAGLWHELARAYHLSGQPAQAIETVEASLRLDESNAAAWRLLATLAADAGNLDLAREALALASERAPDHPELDSLRARIAA